MMWQPDRCIDSKDYVLLQNPQRPTVMNFPKVIAIRGFLYVVVFAFTLWDQLATLITIRFLLNVYMCIHTEIFYLGDKINELH